MKTNAQLFSEYVLLANRYGWFSLRAWYWRFKNRHNTEVMDLVRNAHHVRSLFRQRSNAGVNQWSKTL